MTFEQELTTYSDELLGKAYKLCRNETDAQDLLQDTFARALRFRDKFKMGTNLRAWLHTLMHNLFVNRYRRAQRQRKYQEEAKHVLKENMSDSLSGRSSTPVIARKEFEALFALLEEGISENFFAVMVLCDLQDKSYKQAAEILDIPVGTVMSRLSRGRQYARIYLLNHYDRDFISEFVSEQKLEEVLEKEVDVA